MTRHIPRLMAVCASALACSCYEETGGCQHLPTPPECVLQLDESQLETHGMLRLRVGGPTQVSGTWGGICWEPVLVETNDSSEACAIITILEPRQTGTP